jgi:PncC family amidohydrolase
VVYSNLLKHEALEVPALLLRRHGAVSEEVACALAGSALRLSNADFALALTGTAGPEGGSLEKPVGTVWIGLAVRQGRKTEVRAERFRFPGNRGMVRDRAAKTALNMLRMTLLRPG